MKIVRVTNHAPHLDTPPPRREGSALPVQPHPRKVTEPTGIELATNFGKATARWVAAGMPVVTEADYQARTAACDRCELWDATARFGLGKCKAPGCGCTKLKRWLATEVCKHPQGSRWPALGGISSPA